MAVKIEVSPKFYRVGDVLYRRKENPTANNSTISNVVDLSSEAIGTFRGEKLVHLVPSFVNEIMHELGRARNSGLAGLAKLGEHTWKGMAFVRFIGCLDSIVKDYRGRRRDVGHPEGGQSQPLSSEQALRRDIDFVNTGCDAVAIGGYVLAMVTSCWKSTAHLAAPIGKAADVFTFVHDGADLAGSIQDAYKARKVETSLVQQGQLPTSDIVQSFRETKVNATLRTMKAACAVISGVMAVSIMLGMLKVSAIVLVTFSLLAQIFAIGIALHKKQMREKPIDVVGGFDLSRPVPLLPQQPAQNPLVPATA